MALRRGFRKEAENYAQEFREELGLEAHSPLDPRGLADHLAVPVIGLSEHADIPEKVKLHFGGPGNSDFSATTLADGTYREIIHNDFQHPNRQNSNITHELAHILLGHPPKPPMIDDGCRNFDPTMEKEANELGFSLLVPKVAALFAVENFSDLKLASQQYGVSQSLLLYRIRITDAKNWANNRAKKQCSRA
ncbi:MAG: ImmA/IrrE family metallo-endopeptidase [Alphaproteobacteria bacterium]|nr:ImmA/IrrE family metallo-endopeptidase [Alphaproteobacteria bacterium]